MRALMLDGDGSIYLSRLVVRLARAGVEMHYAGDPARSDFDYLAAGGVACHELRVRHKLDFVARFRLRRLLDEHGIQVLHTVTGRDAYVGLRARGRRRHLRVLVRCGAYAPIRLINPADYFVYGRRGADRVLAVSLDLARHLEAQGLDPARVVPIYTGIWSEEMEPVTADLRVRHGVDKDALLLGIVSNLRPVKGFAYLLEALALLARRRVAFHLLVAGRGYGNAGLRGLDDRITLLGKVADVMKLMPNLDVLVVPSRIDALPRVAIEATVVGTPVIGTRVGGIPEILDEGRAGVLVDPADPATLADALARMASDPAPARALAAAALERNRELFSLERSVAKHLEVYRAAVPPGS